MIRRTTLRLVSGVSALAWRLLDLQQLPRFGLLTKKLPIIPLPTRTRRWLYEGLLASLISMAVFAVYVADRDVTPQSDSIWTLHIAMSVIRAGDTNLDEFEHLIDKDRAYTVVQIGDHIYSFFPLGTPLLITPLMALLDQVALRLWSLDLYAYMRQHPPNTFLALIELVMAAAIVAVAAGATYGLGRQMLNRWQSIGLAVIFAFSTPAWSTASRALWQHGPSMLLLVLTLLFVVRARHDVAQIQFVGLWLALSYVVRPTNAISVVVLTLYVLFTYPRMFGRYLLWAAPVAILFLAYNLTIFGSIFSPYYEAQRIAANPHFTEALWANLISPARGLFIYSPVFLLCGMGLWLKFRHRTFARLDVAVLIIVVLHWVVISSFPHWWGGHAYGPRFFTDMVPYFLYLLVPTIGKVTVRHPNEAGHTWLYALALLILAAVSGATNYRGATQPLTWQWNWAYGELVASVDDDPTRVWDWSDPQFWRGLRRGQLAVTPDHYAVQIVAEQAGVQDVSIQLHNLGDQPLHWQALAPPGLNFVNTLSGDLQRATSMASDSSPIPGGGTLDVQLKFDADRYASGRYSLGGILVQSLSVTGAPNAEAPAVIPISVIVEQDVSAGEIWVAERALDDGRQPIFLPLITLAATGLPEFIPPSDILVNGQDQTDNGADLQGIFGAGWYDSETSGRRHWRWAASPSYLLIRSEARRRIQARLTPAALHANGSTDGLGERGELRVSQDVPASSAGVSIHRFVQVGQPTDLTLELRAGWNVVILELTEGNFRPIDLDPSNGDDRKLGFAVAEINLISN